MFKSEVGLPEPLWPREVDVRAEARTARGRLYPITVAYSSASALTIALVLRSGRSPGVALAFLGAGVATWTLLEYLVHRYVLHGPFPDGPGAIRHFLHRRFDHLHLEHHQRPWDSRHISGSFGDTLPFVALLSAVAALAPINTLPAFLVGLVQSYVIEEWVHHCVHYYNFNSRYFRYIRRHHLYHHSRHGGRVAFGLTSDVWDMAWGTPMDRAVGEGPAASAPRPTPPPARRLGQRPPAIDRCWRRRRGTACDGERATAGCGQRQLGARSPGPPDA
jgi:hypothetical protein